MVDLGKIVELVKKLKEKMKEKCIKSIFTHLTNDSFLHGIDKSLRFPSETKRNFSLAEVKLVISAKQLI